ncbi:amino acid adenylation domain-containing protein [Burkholderia stagnalis]
MNAHTMTPTAQTPVPFDLPRDFPAPLAPRFRRARAGMPVPAAAQDAADRYAQRGGGAAATLWLAALGVALARYADQRSLPLDLIVGADAHGEPARVRVTLDVAADAAVDVLLRATRDALDRRAPPGGDSAPAPVTVSFAGLPADPAEAALSDAMLDDADALFVDSELNFMLVCRDGALSLECEYDEDRYEAATVAGMLTSWLGAAYALPGAGDAPVGGLPLWSTHALAAWRDTLRGPAADIPELTVSALIRAAAARTPDAIAVETATERLTYRELQQRVAQIARAIRARGVRPGERVAVCLARRADLVSVLLGVMTAGCAYVPLDPGYPAARRDFILENADVRLVIAEGAADGAAARPQVSPEALLQDAPGDGAYAHDDDPSAVAYLIYTSGSTGQPKGVRVAHRPAVNLLLAMHERSGLQAGETWLAVTTPMFDIAFAELFVPLVAGGRVWLASRDETADPLALASRIETARARVLQATPATWRMLVAAQWPGKPDLIAVSGGEALDEPLAHALRPRVARLCNVYGPTEATVWATWHDVRDHGFVSIGAPLRNVQLHILDAHGAPVPPGVAGELYIGGAGLADGYHGRDSLTRERFVDATLDGGRTVRLYRTGDLVRASASGAIRWLARLDNQVKLRGFRIELGDIEAALAAIPGVRQAVAVVERLDDDDQRLVAYVVHENGAAGDPAAGDPSARLRDSLRRVLPDYMIPAVFVSIERVPLTDNGKIDRKALPAPGLSAPPAPKAVADGPALERVQAIWQDVLRRPDVGVDVNFFDLGGHSMLLLQMQLKIEQAFGLRVPRIEFFRNPTVAGLAAYLDAHGQPSGVAARPRGRGRGDAPAGSTSVAVVGIGVRVPGASSVDAFWRNLREGVESRTAFSEAELRAAGVSPALLADPNYVRAGFVLDDIDAFDATFFGMSPREAELLDPQQRIFLECAWQALEDAGIDPQKEGDGVGVFAGTDASGYHASVLAPLESDSAPAAAFQIRIGNEKDHLPTRVSYRLNLRGPSVNVQTACSTSLVAVHLAAQSLLRGECDAALAGGVSIHVPHRIGYLYQEGMVASPDGHCRAFDRQGAGTVFGSGAGVVVLKRLDDALAAGDRIYAVVKGTAINNDGSGKVGYTAPSVDGQAAAIMAAHAVAGVDPRAIGYVEAHGTATPLGDPIEIAALTQAFRASTADSEFCAIGSVKTNIGHLDQAAGVAGLIKAALTVFHGEIPPSLHCTETHPDIPFDESPFFVNTQLRAWRPEGGVRIAGVSSFGIGGTNAHAILESAPEVAHAARGEGRGAQVLTLSARSEDALRAQASRYAAFVEAGSADLASICYTANTGRSAFEQRAAWVVRERSELVERLRAFGEGGTLPALMRGVYRNRRPRVAMLFTGQGSQYAGMGRQLYERERAFRAALDECAQVLESELEVGLLEVMYGGSTALLDRTDYTQPALFALGYALRRTWESWGVTPQVVMGHSLGEYVAAQAAGVLTLEDGLRLVAQRGRLMQQRCEGGVMLSVGLDAATLRERLAEQGEGVVIAALNGSQQQVVAGPAAAIDALRSRLSQGGVRTDVLPGSHAFHSPLVEPMLEAYEAVLGATKLSPPRLPLVSNVSGGVAGEEVGTAKYWIEHTRAPVRFGQGIEALAAQGADVLLEIGARPTLTALARQTLGAESERVLLASLRPGRGDVEQMLESVSALHVRGAAIDWPALHRDERPSKVALPTYPFQRRRYWVDAGRRADAPAHRPAVSADAGLHTLLGRRVKLPRSAEVRFEAEFRPDWPAYVDHHRLFGAMVVPGASHIAMFLAAAEVYYGEAGCVVDEILFLRPFVMPEAGQRTVQIVMRPTGGQAHAIEMLTLAPQRDPADDAAWTLHVEARGIRGPRALPPAPDASELDAVKARCADYLSGADFYSKVWIPGMDTGNSFRWIDEIWRGDAEALCRTRLPALLEPIDGPFHAGLVESGFQLLNSCWQFATDELLKTDYIYVPFSIDSYRLYGRPATDRLWVHARIVRQGDGEENGVTADIRVFEDSGRVIAHVHGFEVRRLHRAAVHTLLQGDGADRLFATQWRRVDGLAATPLPADDCVLVVGDAGGTGAALAGRLRASGVRCLRIDAARDAQDAENDAIVPLADATSEPAWRDALRTVAARSGNGVLHVVDLRALDAVADDDAPAGPLALEQRLCGGALALVAALAQGGNAARVTFATRGAQDLGGTPSVARAAQATLAGLARVIAAEHPEWRCRTIDLDPAAADPAAALAPLLHAAADEPQLAIRDGAVHAARLARTKPLRRDAPPLEPNASYLVTGGLGGLGLRLAQQLAQAGVKRLVLMSRGVPDAAAAAAIDALRTQGCTVDLARCDVADLAALRTAWNETVLSGALPLKGIFHAAGALRDGVLGGQSWADFAVPLHAKVAGTLNLHTLSLDTPLDCFVCFSSISALFGTAGQGNYAAANAYVDALAGARRALGLPATSIQWGPFAEVGMAAALDRAHRDKAAARGLQALSPDELLRHVEAARRAEVATVVIGNDDWQRYAQTESSEAVRTLLADWLPKDTADAAPAAGHAVRDRFDATALTALRDALATYLQAQIAAMLGRAAEEVAPTRGYLELGLDSLAAVEFRSQVQRDLRLSLPATFAFDYGNVELGADYLFGRLAAERAPAADDAARATEAVAGDRDGTVADDGVTGNEAADDIDAELARLEASLRR